MIPDLSNAICYYRTKTSRWRDEISFAVIIVMGMLISLTEVYGATHTYLWMKPMLFGEVVSIFGFIGLAADLPTLFYSGPTIAISSKGLYYEFNGGVLGLIPWDDIDYFVAGNAGRWQTPVINMYIKNKADMFVHIEEQLGRLPFLVVVQKLFMRTSIPRQIYANSFTTGSRDSVLEELKSALNHHQGIELE